MTEASLDHDLLLQLVAAFADCELPPGESRAVQEHLRKCARCQREWSLQQGLSQALAQEPAGAASAGLRRRIERIGLPAPRGEALSWRSRAAPVAAAALVAFLIVGGAAYVSIGVGRAGALIARQGQAGRPIAEIPLLRDAAADCRRAMARTFPRKADLQAVGEGLQFPIRALDRPDADLFSTWKTALAGAPAVGLAYRWRGIVVVQYAVPAELLRQQPEVGETLRGAGFYSTSQQGQGIVASLVNGSGTLLVADAPPEELRRLIL